MRRLIEGLLALGRASSESLTREQVDATQVVRERVADWTSLAEEAGITLRLSASEPAPVLAVPTAVEQIVDNYIDNALSVLEDGGTITVSLNTDGERVTIAVSDDGPGLPGSDAARAFDRFWRGSSTTEGTGLGLAIVKQLAQASGATVSLAPRQPRGTIASVSFEKA